jgi:hypothetical protein
VLLLVLFLLWVLLLFGRRLAQPGPADAQFKELRNQDAAASG